MILTREFIEKRIREQREYVEEKTEAFSSIFSAYQDEMISVSEFKRVAGRIKEHIDQARLQEKYFCDLLKQLDINQEIHIEIKL